MLAMEAERERQQTETAVTGTPDSATSTLLGPKADG